MIYCVVPQALADELYDRLVAHYADDPNVEVIVDRRGGPDRRHTGADDSAAAEQRAQRDRRRSRPGTFPPVDPPR